MKFTSIFQDMAWNVNKSFPEEKKVNKIIKVYFYD